jgi:propanol-preferring alcohol dehydrogenase
VVAIGDLVTDVQIGDHAGVKWLNGSCLACEFCQSSDEPLCPKPLLSGYTVDGTFQQYCIAKAAHVARIPKSCDLAAIAPILCAGITVYKGLKESGVKPGQWAAIVGAGGGLGSLACQYAKAMGVRTIAIDTGAEKKKMCTEQLGAECFVDFATSKNVVADVQKATPDGLGPHVVILVAVNEKPFQQAAEYVRPRGTVICIGLPAGAYLKAPVFESVIKMVRIQGSYVGNRKDSAEAIDFYARGLIKAPFKVVGLSELQMVYGKCCVPTVKSVCTDFFAQTRCIKAKSQAGMCLIPPSSRQPETRKDSPSLAYLYILTQMTIMLQNVFKPRVCLPDYRRTTIQSVIKCESS